MPYHTLESLNDVAQPFLRGGSFTVVNWGCLKIYYAHVGPGRARRSPFYAADLSAQRNWFRHRAIPRVLGLGGTDEQTVCQLILWWRGLPRLPGRVLKWWQERNAAFGAKLDEVGYDDALSLNCVLCGKPPDGLDWRSLNDVTGPCCSFGRCGGCREKPNA